MLYYTYYLFIYVYKAFLLHLIKAWVRTMMKETEELENKLNEMGALLMKLKKGNKLDKRSSCNPVVFKHDCSLASHLLWRKTIPGH